MSVQTARRRGRKRVRGKVFVGLCGGVLLLGLGWLYSPMAAIRQESDQLALLRMKKAALEQEQADLESYKAQAATETGREAEARRQGYLRPGERRIVFFREEAPAEETAEVGEGTTPAPE
jgi:hypothetical protein